MRPSDFASLKEFLATIDPRPQRYRLPDGTEGEFPGLDVDTYRTAIDWFEARLLDEGDSDE